ncbi:MAG: DUF1385 domain-containing protein [Chloroflexi bacterium]|nr:DUF1385 domain-containing protein [Chloroflexota bacterium]
MTSKPLKLPSYGGQALIEGVLMRGSKFVAAAMRGPDGIIQIKVEKLQGIYTSNIRKIPFLRGAIILWDAIGLGSKYLTLSANLQTGEDEKIEGPALFGTLFLSFSIAIALFFLVPAGLASLLSKWLIISPIVINLIEGIIRLIFVIVYIWSVSKIPDIRRVFAYHGAEHKTINAFEAGVELTPENVSRFSLHHPRCGTGFILILVLFSIILFSIIGPIPNIFLKLLSRVFFLPFLVMLAYEFTRFSSNHLTNRWVKLLSAPGMAMQNLTTFEPTDDILEVAIASFNAMYEHEQEQNEVELK